MHPFMMGNMMPWAQMMMPHMGGMRQNNPMGAMPRMQNMTGANPRQQNQRTPTQRPQMGGTVKGGGYAFPRSNPGGLTAGPPTQDIPPITMNPYK